MSAKSLAIIVGILFSVWLAFHLATRTKCACGS